MKKLITISMIFLGLFLFVGISQATEANLLQPAATITYNEDLTVNGTGRFNSIYVGQQGVGGVTFFNGTIVNATTGDNNYDNPVTFGDGVRIDGLIWGGPNKGNSSDQGLKIADSLLPGLTAVNDIGSDNLEWNNLYAVGGNFSNSLKVQGGDVWTSENDGVGSGLNADLLDGMHSTSFAPLNHAHDLLYVSKSIPRWNAQTSYLVLPAPNFQPIEDGYDYSNNAIKLQNDDSASDLYNGAVNLPHNSVVTGFEFGWNDSDASYNVCATLNRIHNINHGSDTLASLCSSGSSGLDNRSATAIISNETIDNFNYRYVVSLNLPTSGTDFYNAKITYTIDRPY